ncbi:response regulator [Numidum massiliense]|uniref:response regulator n=1 Tax=Numidum massiliense TaxID=1522315 RepID=UPI0006D5A631|nr:response regulator transcription factor [Numidum massiliense]
MNTTGKSILVVEDDAKIRELIKVYLEQAGFEVIEAGDGREAKQLFQREDPCFVIIDLMLPETSGESVCEWIRTELKSDVPLMMVTAKVAEQDRVRGLQMGADDYMTKPFSPRELVARVETVLRRTAHRCNKLTYRGIVLKPQKREVKFHGHPVALTPHEFQLLHFFMRHPNQILTRSQLLDELYPHDDKVVSERTIDVHIGKVREKLGRIEAEVELIETVRGMGYRFVAY